MTDRTAAWDVSIAPEITRRWKAEGQDVSLTEAATTYREVKAMRTKQHEITEAGASMATSPSETPHPRSTAIGSERKCRASLITSLSALLIAGCSGHNTTASLPSDASRTASPASPTASATASHQTVNDIVVNAYKDFLAAANRAITAPATQTRPILKEYATGDFLEFQIRQVAVHQRAHEEPWGKAIVHITKLQIDGSTAVVHDCQDDSAAGLANRRTHRLISESRGRANQNLIADMTLGGDGKWRVAGLRLHQSACHVP